MASVKSKPEMLSQGKKSVQWLIISALIIILAIVAVYFIKGYSLGSENTRLTFNDRESFNSGWTYTNKSGNTVKIQDSDRLYIEQGVFSMSNILPESAKEGKYVFFYSEMNAVSVHIDDKLVYNYAQGEKKTSQTLIGNIMCMIKLPADSTGKPITIQFDSASSAVTVPSVMIGSDGAALAQFIVDRAVPLIYIISMLTVSIAMFILFSAQKGVGTLENVNAFYLGTLVIISMIWILSDTQILQLLIKNSRIVSMLRHYAIIVMPIPFLLYVRNISKRMAPLFDGLCIISLVDAFVVSILYATGLKSLDATQYITFGTIIVELIICVVALNIKPQRLAHIVLCGIYIFAGYMAVCVAVCSTYAPARIQEALLYYTGIVFFLCYLAVVTWKQNRKLLQEHIHFDTYKRMAYIDAMTGISNRTAYDQRIAYLLKNPHEVTDFGVLTADLNNLKEMNDTFGHEVGDTIIIALAQCLHSAANGIAECYRIGGDEFAVLVVNSRDSSIVSRVKAEIDKYNATAEHHISAAYGYVDEHDNISAPAIRWVIKKAEDVMYVTKRDMHTTAAEAFNAENASPGQEQFADSLTGVLNIAGFRARVREALESRTDDNPDHAFIIDFDINRFENLNTIYGHEVCDDMLRAIARIIRDAIGKNGICSRLEADHFALMVVLPDIQSVMSHIMTTNQTLTGILPINRILISYGIYEVREKAESVDIMLDKARAAKRLVKGNYSHFIGVYSDDIHVRMLQESELCLAMEDALKNGEFVPYYQPKYDCRTERIVGAEALTRWIRPDGSMLMPDKFIGIFERNMQIISLDWYIFEHVCEFLGRQYASDAPCVTISVNFSRVHTFDDAFMYKLLEIVSRYGVPHRLLEIELTESALSENHEEVVRCMQWIREKGFIVSVDDFGTGLSTLALLKDLRCDVIKIDKSFLSTSTASVQLDTMLECIIYYAGKHKLLTVAEGVETREQFDMMRDAGCDIVQGFCFDYPMTEDDFVKRLKKCKVGKMPIAGITTRRLGQKKSPVAN